MGHNRYPHLGQVEVLNLPYTTRARHHAPYSTSPIGIRANPMSTRKITPAATAPTTEDPTP